MANSQRSHNQFSLAKEINAMEEYAGTSKRPLQSQVNQRAKTKQLDDNFNLRIMPTQSSLDTKTRNPKLFNTSSAQ